MTETTTHNIYRLARLADVRDPDSADSPGGQWLLQVATYADETAEGADSIEDVEDAIDEAADACVPIYTHNAWQIWTDLCLYQEADDVASEYGLPETAQYFLNLTTYAVAQRLIRALVEEAIENAEGEG